MSRFLLAAALALQLLTGLLGGCTMIPRYEAPAMPTAAAWPGEEGRDAASSPENMSWKDFFTDEGVRRLLALALDNNRDLRIAVLHIEKARAQYQIQRADLLPTVHVSGSESIQHLPGDIMLTQRAGISRQYDVTVGFSAYELDLFGRVRSLKESALQQFLATGEAAGSAQVSIVAEVAGAYLHMAANRELHALAKETHANRRETYELVEKLFSLGVASQLTLNQARMGLEDMRVQLAQAQTRAAQSLNALVLLLGVQTPPDMPMPDNLDQIRALPDIAPGIPSDLLLRRPDVRGAEHRLKAAYADIGAARANFFPRIGLTTAIGTISTQFADLFSGGAGTWLFAPQVTLPIFDTGRNWAILKGSEADRDIAVAGYEKTIQTAFREVADSLAQRAAIEEQVQGQRALVEAARESYEISLSRFTTGLDSYINVLDAQRALFAARQGLVAARLLREVNALTLYKALGGGWQ